MFTRRKLLGKQLAGAKAFAANPDPAAAGSALCAHFSRGVGFLQLDSRERIKIQRNGKPSSANPRCCIQMSRSPEPGFAQLVFAHLNQNLKEDLDRQGLDIGLPNLRYL